MYMENLLKINNWKTIKNRIGLNGELALISETTRLLKQRGTEENIGEIFPNSLQQKMLHLDKCSCQF